MRLITGAIVEAGDLLATVLYALLFGIGVTLLVSFGVYGSTRYADLSRDDRPIGAAAAAALGIIALIATIALVVIGLVLMASK